MNVHLNHKAHGYEPREIVVEKVISLYGKRFEQMRDHPLEDAPEIIENRELIAKMADVVIRVKNGKIRSCEEQTAPMSADEVEW